jgi:hypothetical protein
MRLLRHRDETPVRVRALTASAGFGPGTTFRFGEVFDVPAWRAKELIAAGSAPNSPPAAPRWARPSRASDALSAVAPY